MAIIMVMSVISLLTYLLADFTFESKVNKLKVYNIQDRAQAKLNAESGMTLAMARLKIYKEARNIIAKNKALKGAIDNSVLEKILTIPFKFPLPEALTKKADILQRKIIKEFTDSIIIEGEIFTTISPVTGFLNPNNLRIPAPKRTSQANNSPSGYDENNHEKKKPHEYIYDRLVETLANKLKDLKENDENFQETYGEANPELLIQELSFYVNPRGKFEGSYKSEIETLYSTKEITPKHAPLTSISELYLLAGWNDQIVKIMKNELTAHEVSIIPVNTLTKEQLKVLFPELSLEQADQFFKFRDGDLENEIPPSPLKSANDFKTLLTETIGGVDEQTYDKRIASFKAAGIEVGVGAKLYKMISIGKKGRAEYRMTAFIDLPKKPSRAKKKSRLIKNPSDPAYNQKAIDREKERNKKKKEPIQFLDPHILEIIIG